MEKITFDQLPEMVALILEKIERIERLIGNDNIPIQETREILTVQKAAEFMDVSTSTLYKMSFNRTLPVYKPTGKKIYFKKTDLIDWMSRNRLMSQSEIEQEALNYVTNHPLKKRK